MSARNNNHQALQQKSLSPIASLLDNPNVGSSSSPTREMEASQFFDNFRSRFPTPLIQSPYDSPSVLPPLQHQHFPSHNSSILNSRSSSFPLSSSGGLSVPNHHKSHDGATASNNHPHPQYGNYNIQYLNQFSTSPVSTPSPSPSPLPSPLMRSSYDVTNCFEPVFSLINDMEIKVNKETPSRNIIDYKIFKTIISNLKIHVNTTYNTIQQIVLEKEQEIEELHEKLKSKSPSSNTNINHNNNNNNNNSSNNESKDKFKISSLISNNVEQTQIAFTPFEDTESDCNTSSDSEDKKIIKPKHQSVRPATKDGTATTHPDPPKEDWATEALLNLTQQSSQLVNSSNQPTPNNTPPHPSIDRTNPQKKQKRATQPLPQQPQQQPQSQPQQQSQQKSSQQSQQTPPKLNTSGNVVKYNFVNESGINNSSNSNSNSNSNNNNNNSSGNNSPKATSDKNSNASTTNTNITNSCTNNNVTTTLNNSSNNTPTKDASINNSIDMQSSSSEGEEGANNSARKRKRGKLPGESTSILKSWLFEHNMHPYPTEDEKAMLAGATSLSFSQINNWFTNARRRILPKTLDRKVYGSPLFSHFSMPKNFKEK